MQSIRRTTVSASFLHWTFCAAISLLALTAHAAPVPWRKEEVSFAAREQPLRDFLQELFSSQGLPVVISNAVQGTVNGNFAGPPEQVFEDIRRAFSLLPYYDGAIVHIYLASEASSRTISMPRDLVPRLMQTMRELRLLDARHSASTAAEGLVVLSGSRRFIEQAEEVARSLQVQASTGPSVFRLFPLKYAWAHDITLTYSGRQIQVPGVASLLRSLIGSPSGGGLYLDRPERLLRPTVEKLGGKGLRSIGEDGRAVERETVFAEEPHAEYVSTPISGDQARIEADRRLNAVIVRDSKDRMPYYEQLIAALDTEPQVIEIEARIVDIDTNRLRDLGVSWRVTTEDGDEALFGEGNEGDLRLRPGEDITPAGEGFFISSIIGNADTFVSRIHALETEDAANVVSRPQVVTLNNVEAIIESNRSFYVRVAGEFDVDLFNVVAGTTLRVTPHVLREEGKTPRIRMLVNIEDGSVTDARVDQIPVIDRSAINTQGLIAEGESLLIGGLVREESFSTVSRVPVLGRIPILGRLFSRTSKSSARIERLFLITPRLIPAGTSLGGPGPAPAPGSPGPGAAPVPTPSPAPGLPPVPPPGAAPAPQTPPATPAPEREGG